MMSLLEDLKENLRQSHLMAKNSSSESDQVAWRRMAAQWWRLVQILSADEGEFAEFDDVDDSTWPTCFDADNKSTH